MGDFIEIEIADIPEYLKKSNLYEVFNENLGQDNDKIHVPKKYLKENEKIDSFFDLENLLHTYRYWMIKKISYKKIFNFVSKNKNHNYSSLIKKFYKEFPFIIQLSYLSKVDKLDVNYLILSGYLNLLKYYCLKNKNIKFNREACELAILRGDLKIISFMTRKVCNWNSKCCDIAIKNNSIKLLKFLHDKGCNFSESACNYAVEKNNLECLKFLIENNAKVDCDICQDAAEYNSLECLQYLVENGHNIDKDVVDTAAINYSYEVLKYVVPICSNFKDNLLERMVYYFEDEKVDNFKKCFEYLIELGQFITNKLIKISLNGNNLNLLKIILEAKSDFDKNTLFGRYETKDNSLCIKYINDNFPNLAIGLNSFKEMESLREEMLINQNKSKEIEILKDFDTNLSCKVIYDL